MDILLNNQTNNYNDDPNRLWVEIDRGLCLSLVTFFYLRSLLVQVFDPKNHNDSLRLY